MSSQIDCHLPESISQFNSSSNASQEFMSDPPVLRQFDFPNSARKMRSDFLAVPKDKVSFIGFQSAVKETYQTRENTAFKPINPSRFAASDTKTKCQAQTTSIKSELVRQYQLALDQIESALTQKNFELTKALRQMEITLQQKERYIEETTTAYEQQIKTIESAYFKATQKIMELQNTCKNQAIRLEECELKLVSQSDNFKKLSAKYEAERGNILIRDRSIQELTSLLNSEKVRTKDITEEMKSAKIDTEELNKMKVEIEILRNSLSIKVEQCSNLRELAERLQIDLRKASSDLVGVSETLVMFKQSEKLLGETHLIGNLMLTELNETKTKLANITSLNEESKKTIERQSQELITLRFQKKTLSEYNKVLTEKLNAGQPDRSRQSKWTSKTASTFCYPGSV